VAARRLGQDEAYLTVREVLSEASTVADGVLCASAAILAGVGLQH
jgi:hypothetical protein